MRACKKTSHVVLVPRPRCVSMDDSGLVQILGPRKTELKQTRLTAGGLRSLPILALCAGCSCKQHTHAVDAGIQQRSPDVSTQHSKRASILAPHSMSQTVAGAATAGKSWAMLDKHNMHSSSGYFDPHPSFRALTAVRMSKQRAGRVEGMNGRKGRAEEGSV